MPVATSENFWFDEKAADRVCGFFVDCLVHVKGQWAGRPFELLDWEREALRDLFGWKRPDGTRRYRTAYISVPRKQGKSSLSAGIALYLLCADGEPGAEVFSAAADKDQAAIVFELAKSMVLASPELSKRLEVFRRSMVYAKTSSSYKVLSADAYRQHGINASGVIFDELHAQRNRELWDVLTTSTGSRSQPLVLAISTAGYDETSICWEVDDYARKVREGVVEDTSFYSYVRRAEKEDDWTDPEVWKAANPSFGITIFEDYFTRECERAQNTPAYQNTFRRLHLNQWTAQRDRWLDLAAWDECDEFVDLEALQGRQCYGGMDLATTTDVAAFVLVFPPDDEDGVFDVAPFFWVPNDGVPERVRRDGVPYDAWIRDGLIHATEGNVIDYRAILRTIEDLGERYNVAEIAYDRWGSQAISNELAGLGFKLVQFGQGYGSMSSPTSELLKLVLAERIRHGGHPVLRWMADNLVVKSDPAGNVKPDKQKSTEKIDGMVALIMALDRAIRKEGAPKLSVYATRGLETLEWGR